MKTILITILFLMTTAISLNALENKSYVAFEKLNESMYTVDNEDFILGLGIKMKSSQRLNFILAYEGDIYNEKTNSSFIYPADKLSSYIKGGSLNYKLNYKF